MNPIIIVLFVLMAWVSFYAIYFNFLRPVAQTRFQFMVNETADELDILLLAEKAQPTDEAVSILLGRIDRARWLIPEIDIRTILLAASYGEMRPKSRVEEEEGTIRSSAAEIKALSHKLDIAVIGAFATNSPFLVGMAVIAIIGVAMFSAFASSLQSMLTKCFWMAIYTKSDHEKSVVIAAAA